MSLTRRGFLGAMAAGAGTLIARPAQGAGLKRYPGYPDRFGLLHDTTLCVGCRSCEEACKEVNNLPPPKADLDPFTNAICRAYHTPAAKEAARRPLTGWKVDHLRVECKGGTFKITLNGKDVFAKAITGGEASAGTFGLFSSGSYYFDNVLVRPAR